MPGEVAGDGVGVALIIASGGQSGISAIYIGEDYFRNGLVGCLRAGEDVSPYLMGAENLVGSLSFDSVSLFGVVEDCFQAALLPAEAGVDLFEIEVTPQPRHILGEVVVAGESVIDPAGEPGGPDALTKWLSEKPRDVEEALVLGQNCIAAVENQLPESGGVVESEGRGQERGERREAREWEATDHSSTGYGNTDGGAVEVGVVERRLLRRRQETATGRLRAVEGGRWSEGNHIVSLCFLLFGL
jgi:hypothetical protein